MALVFNGLSTLMALIYNTCFNMDKGEMTESSSEKVDMEMVDPLKFQN